MIVTAIRTTRVLPNDDWRTWLNAHLPKLEAGDVVVIASKILSLCLGCLHEPVSAQQKQALIRAQADEVLNEPESSKFNIMWTITQSILVPNAGVDESNTQGFVATWPKELPKLAIEIWQYIRDREGQIPFGVIIADSRSMPLRWGVIGVGLAWCGFEPLRDYRSKPDVFGRPLNFTQTNLVDGLAAAAVLEMGEANEQKPLCIIRGASGVSFSSHPPSVDELTALKVNWEQDLFSPILRKDKQGVTKPKRKL